MPDYHQLLVPESFYHIISRAVGDEKIFRSDDNYRFILQRYQRHVSSIADTFAWCLLPNHFHFLVRIKPVDLIRKHFDEVKKNKIFHPAIAPDFIMERFSNWLNSYTKSFNKMFNRKGALFIDYLRRVEIENDSHFRSVVFYIHKNPVHHRYCSQIEAWKWSSYHDLVSAVPGWLQKEEVINWFDGIKGFLQYHRQEIIPKNVDDI